MGTIDLEIFSGQFKEKMSPFCLQLRNRNPLYAGEDLAMQIEVYMAFILQKEDCGNKFIKRRCCFKVYILSQCFLVNDHIRIKKNQASIIGKLRNSKFKD